MPVGHGPDEIDAQALSSVCMQSNMDGIVRADWKIEASVKERL